MQAINLRYQLHLHWRKVISILLLCFIVVIPSFSQARFNPIHSSGQEHRALSYGFFLAAHTSTLRVRYSNDFLNQTEVVNVMPLISKGFSLGFLGALKLHDQLSLNLTPKVGFYEYLTNVYFSDGNILMNNNTKAYMTEFPVFIKYRSQRFNNNRMFITAGASPMFRTQPQDVANNDDLVINGRDITLDVSMGFDLYFKFFRLSPEIKFSHGLTNIYYPQETDPRYNSLISDIRRRTVSIIFNFQ
jgi:hypothetical protein